MNKSFITLSAALLAAAVAQAKVELPNFITDNMVVQQNSTLTITGKALHDSKVTVNPGWSDKTYTFKADKSGNFSAPIATPEAGGPYSLTISDPDGDLTLENILSGEVWICSGQSNMEFPLKGWGQVMNLDEELSTGQYGDIRLLHLERNYAFSPQEDAKVIGGGWQLCSPASLEEFSAIAYFFARELAREVKVPVGVINTSWGGTPAESWTPAAALGAIPGFESELAQLVEAGYDADKMMENYLKHYNEVKENVDKQVLESKDDSQWKTIYGPGLWEDNGLLGLDGVVLLKRDIDIPESLAGKPLNIRMAGVDDNDETYFNDTLVGKTNGWTNERNYAVRGDLVKAGRNTITVKVTDFGGGGGLVKGVCQAEFGGITIPLEGEWKYNVLVDFHKSVGSKCVFPQTPLFPSVLYNAMIYPLRNMPVRGAIWYQGCNNVGRDEQYTPLFQTMINSWRELWGKDMPFYFVQLAAFNSQEPVQPNSSWALLRNSQAKALNLDNTGMAVAIDLGHPTDIHPKNKQEVARRLALIALARDYGKKDLTYAAPRCVKSVVDGNAMLLTFDGPVHATSVAHTGFIIGGSDGKFTTATVKAESPTVLRVWAKNVKKPVAVRYDWADYPCGNLYGPTELPVAPFATDQPIFK